MIDLYWLHRDDPRLEVQGIVDYLNSEVRRGRIRYFGASNWTAARIAKANEYALQSGQAGFVASQPMWSLAQPREPEATLRFFHDEDRRWHEQSGLPVMPYTPTASGYFAGGGQGGTFDTPQNVAARQRAIQLASQKGCTPNQIALAFLMCHPFPVIPILGTRRLNHLADGLGAANVKLTPNEIEWLLKG